MMGIACFLCVVAALIVSYIVQKRTDLSSIAAFLSSWVAVMLMAGGLKLKEKSDRGTALFKFTKIAGFLCVCVVLYPGMIAFPQDWREAAGFGSKAFLVWLALLALMSIWVIFHGGEEKDRSPPLPPDV